MIDITEFEIRIDKSKFSKWITDTFADKTNWMVADVNGEMGFSVKEVRWPSGENDRNVIDDFQISGTFTFVNTELAVAVEGSIGVVIKWEKTRKIIPFELRDLVLGDDLIVIVNDTSIKCSNTLNILAAKYKDQLLKNAENGIKRMISHFLKELYLAVDKSFWGYDTYDISLILVENTRDFMVLSADFTRLKEPLPILPVPAYMAGMKINVPTQYMINIALENGPGVIEVQNQQFTLSTIEILDTNLSKIILDQVNGKKKVSVIGHIVISDKGIIKIKVANLTIEGIGFFQKAIFSLFKGIITSKIEEKEVDILSLVDIQRRNIEAKYSFMTLPSLTSWKFLFFSISPDYTSFSMGI
ncbi:hypothetical protein [Membranihabitans maritimus]|uniref:hypothetical protein n=1 Tax=Membranihabitans maritimus TaxID=2904244 RepID=UPI001F478B99|nr:hypothetical protein [Membranihabitans maritimus]